MGQLSHDEPLQPSPRVPGTGTWRRTWNAAQSAATAAAPSPTSRRNRRRDVMAGTLYDRTLTPAPLPTPPPSLTRRGDDSQPALPVGCAGRTFSAEGAHSAPYELPREVFVGAALCGRPVLQATPAQGGHTG